MVITIYSEENSEVYCRYVHKQCIELGDVGLLIAMETVTLASEKSGAVISVD